MTPNATNTKCSHDTGIPDSRMPVLFSADHRASGQLKRCAGIVFLFAAFLSCNDPGHGKVAQPADGSVSQPGPVSQGYRLSDTSLLSLITDTLMHFEFIQHSNRFIDSLTNHRQGLAFMLDTAGHHIQVTAGYNGKDRFETYYNFTIDPATKDIRVTDPLTGDLLTIDEFIKKSKEQ